MHETIRATTGHGATSMDLRRIVPNLDVDDATTGHDFYEEFLGLRKEFGIGWIVVDIVGHADQFPLCVERMFDDRATLRAWPAE
jgi:hypothetical protein